MVKKDNDGLRAIFREVRPLEPPALLEEAIMARVRKRSVARSAAFMVIFPTLGVALMLATLALVFSYTDPGLDMTSLLPRFDFEWLGWESVVPVSAILPLLVADTLIRKRLKNRRENARGI